MEIKTSKSKQGGTTMKDTQLIEICNDLRLDFLMDVLGDDAELTVEDGRITKISFVGTSGHRITFFA